MRWVKLAPSLQNAEIYTPYLSCSLLMLLSTLWRANLIIGASQCNNLHFTVQKMLCVVNASTETSLGPRRKAPCNTREDRVCFLIAQTWWESLWEPKSRAHSPREQRDEEPNLASARRTATMVTVCGLPEWTWHTQGFWPPGLSFSATQHRLQAPPALVVSSLRSALLFAESLSCKFSRTRVRSLRANAGFCSF